MPILSKEVDLFPADLLDKAWTHQGEQRWWALYSLPRHEKQLMRRLHRLGSPFYGPLITHRTRSPAGRIRESYVPLFAGYVFLYGDDAARYQAMTTNCVSRSLAVPDGPQLTADLKRIQRLIDLEVPLSPESRLESGQFVRVRSGAFVGQEGVVIRRHGETRLLVALNFLQQGVSVLLDDCQLERID